MAENQYPDQMDKWNPTKVRAAIRALMQKQKLEIPSWTRAAGLADSTLRNFLDGLSQSLNLESAVKLAASAKVTVSQLIGEETPDPIHAAVLNEDILRQAIEELESYLTAIKRVLQPADKAEAIGLMYRFAADRPGEPVKIAGTPYENVIRLFTERRG